MKILRAITIAFALLPMAISGTALAFQAQAHLGHVATAWGDTPEGVGLLVAAEREAAIAAQHAQLALADPGNLAAIQAHTRHVMHALDPSSQDGGPGLGYGVAKAAMGVGTHIGLAARADDASEAVKLHSDHIGTSAGNVVTWAAAAVIKGADVLKASDSESAAELAGEVAAIVDAIVNGTDANGDGSISWQSGEGGLAQARFHLDLLMKAEGSE